MTIAWLGKKKLPRPGAIGIFCEGADYKVSGDSSFWAVPLIQSDGARLPPPPAHPQIQAPQDAYLGEVSREDRQVAPALYPDLLATFPPTLIITGTRDIALSAAVHTHAALVKVGVDADLHVWDGMWHSFFVDVDLPESREVYGVVAKFFATHLGRRRATPP
jgi:acetyl esterase/lipase